MTYRTKEQAGADEGLRVQSPLQRAHKRQAQIPSVFADATLAAAIATANTEAKRAARAKAARQAMRLIRRGELEVSK